MATQTRSRGGTKTTETVSIEDFHAAQKGDPEATEKVIEDLQSKQQEPTPEAAGDTSNETTGQAESTRFGERGRAHYEAVLHYLAEGMNRNEAFAKRAEETGARPGTIATAFYREARRDPDSPVTHRPRSGPRTATQRSVSAPRKRGKGQGSRDLDAAADALHEALVAYIGLVKDLAKEHAVATRTIEQLRTALS